MKLAWGTDYFVSGNAYGYSYHSKMMKEHTSRLIEFSKDADDVVVILPGDKYQRIPNKHNFLFCLAPDTKVLTADLQWLPIKQIKIGDELIGFDEDLSLNHKNKIRRSIVQGMSFFKGEAMKIYFKDGNSVIASPNHQWVTRNHKQKREWKRTDNLKSGDRIIKFRDTWEAIENYETGWLAGFFDGEGFVSNSKRGTGNIFGFAQNDGEILERACRILKKYGIDFTVNNQSKTKKCKSVMVKNPLRALGIIRPSRLLPKAKYLWEGKRSWGKEYTEPNVIERIEYLGICDLVGTKTTTGTLIAEGMLSHNTMFEADKLPNNYLWGIEQADEIITPCRFSKDLISRYTDKPISVCHEGVDCEVFKFKERNWIKGAEPFRLLWVGAPNPRKGWPIVQELIRVLEQFKDVEIYMKTTVPKVDYSDKEKMKQAKDIYAQDPEKQKRIEKLVDEAGNELGIGKKSLHGMLERIGKNKNVIFDTRDLSQKELVELYHSAHAFILPSFGEGWGLTLSEAMATGLPCIATSMMGTADFFDEYVGFTIKWEWKESDFHYYNLRANVCCPSAQHAFDRVMEVIKNYKEAKRRGARAAARIRNKFTWEMAAKRLVEIVDTSRKRRGIYEASCN